MLWMDVLGVLEAIQEVTRQSWTSKFVHHSPSQRGHLHVVIILISDNNVKD